MMHPGSQARTKHRVLPKRTSDSLSSGVRYSVSFRNIISNDTANILTQDEGEAKTDTTLIFGSSIPKKLDSKKLAGKSGKTVLNLAVGGAKIRDM